MKITACWIAKNEAANIGTSINSVKEATDELIVLDTGSTDDTAAVAESLGARVVPFEWVNDFSAARNHAISLASGNIIIFLDSDEWFNPPLKQADHVKICGIFANHPHVDMLTLPITNIDTRTGAILNATAVCRIFRNKKTLRYVGRVHEYIPSTGKNAFTCNDYNIYHSGYSNEVMSGKLTRNLTLLETASSEAADGSMEKARFLLYLIREYHNSKSPKASECLLEILKHPTEAAEKACLQHSEEFVSNLYASIWTASCERARISRRNA
jgi:glycosyltransferase involved in cell wall biosynthesis